MRKGLAEPASHLATMSARLPVRLVGKLYTIAAEDRKPVETIVHQALERWIDAREREGRADDY